MTQNAAITDYNRCLFMTQMAKAHASLNLSDWESSFLNSWKAASRQIIWFTDPRRVATDKMWRQFGSLPEIGMPFPVALSVPPGVPRADPECCDYLVRDGGNTVRCNEPALWRRRKNDFHYCQTHAEKARESFERKGKVLNLERVEGV